VPTHPNYAVTTADGVTRIVTAPEVLRLAASDITAVHYSGQGQQVSAARHTPYDLQNEIDRSEALDRERQAELEAECADDRDRCPYCGASTIEKSIGEDESLTFCANPDCDQLLEGVDLLTLPEARAQFGDDLYDG